MTSPSNDMHMAYNDMLCLRDNINMRIILSLWRWRRYIRIYYYAYAGHMHMVMLRDAGSSLFIILL